MAKSLLTATTQPIDSLPAPTQHLPMLSTTHMATQPPLVMRHTRRHLATMAVIAILVLPQAINRQCLSATSRIVLLLGSRRQTVRSLALSTTDLPVVVIRLTTYLMGVAMSSKNTLPYLAMCLLLLSHRAPALVLPPTPSPTSTVTSSPRSTVMERSLAAS